MTRKVYIDPSITCAGVAVFVDSVFKEGYLITPKGVGYSRLTEMLCEAGDYRNDEIYFEEPIMRMRGRGPACKPSDLVKLSASAGALIANVGGARVGAVQPHQWKGSIPKEVTHRHMWNVLSVPEQEAIKKARGRKSLIHNLYDAVCIGLYLEGRAPWKRLDTRHLLKR